jgi:hypothetical protein
MKVTLKAGCNLSFTRRYCPQAIEEYERWGFIFGPNGINVTAETEMSMDEITSMVKYFTHRETKYDLSAQNLTYIPNAPYYPGPCLIQVTKLHEGPGARYWGREKHEVEYYMKCEEEMHGPQEDKWYITLNDEDKELTPEEYEIQSPKSAASVGRPTTEPIAYVELTPQRASMENLLAVMSNADIERLVSITTAAFPDLSVWKTSNRFASPPNIPMQQWTPTQCASPNSIWRTENQVPSSPNSIWSIDSQPPFYPSQF